MLSSMTGFGRAASGALTVEIQSVNRKFLEVSVSLPREFSSFEQQIRKLIAEKISRGQVFVRIFITEEKFSLPNTKLLKELKKHWQTIAKEVGTDPKEITLAFLLQNLSSKPEISKKEEGALEKVIESALEELLKMKKVEGKALAKDLSDKLQLLSKLLEKIEKHAPDATTRMRQRLSEKLSEIFQGGPEVEERLLREVAVFAEKVDIAEEITRLQSHFSQFKETLKGEGVGRKMDFLIQEIGREINTIGSKSMESAITRLVVEMKSELEKMREQVQNLE